MKTPEGLLIGRKIWYTFGSCLVIGKVVRRGNDGAIEVEESPGNFHTFNVDSVHWEIESAINGCEDAADYWSRRAEELRSTRSVLKQ